MVTLKEKQDLIGNKLFAVDFTSEEGFSKLLGILLDDEVDVNFENDYSGIVAKLKKGNKTYVAHKVTKNSALLEATLRYLDRGPGLQTDSSTINAKLFGITYDYTTPEGFVQLLSKLNETYEVTFNTYDKPYARLNEEYPSTGDTYAEALINAAYEMLK